MKKKIKILVVFILLLSCKSEINKKTYYNSVTKKEINKFLDDWHLAASNANYKNYFNSLDSVSVFIGTDASENWSKKQFSEFSKPYFDKGKAWDFKPLERNIYFSPKKDFVWFDEVLTTWMGICRGSGVIEIKQDSIKIKHYVLSVTIPNDNIKEITNINKVKDSLFLRSKFNYYTNK